MFLLTAAFLAYVFALFGTILYALVRGGWSERAAAIALLVAVIATQLAALIEPARGPQYGVMLVDAALVVALFGVSARSKGYWPIWATASQLIGTLTHGAAILRPRISIELYASTQPFWVFPLLAAIAAGTFNYRRDRKRLSS
ncbi:MAG: hypothetical protein V4537_16090 [Pseudomonadota bacterium]